MHLSQVVAFKNKEQCLKIRKYIGMVWLLNSLVKVMWTDRMCSLVSSTFLVSMPLQLWDSVISHNLRYTHFVHVLHHSMAVSSEDEQRGLFDLRLEAFPRTENYLFLIQLKVFFLTIYTCKQCFMMVFIPCHFSLTLLPLLVPPPLNHNCSPSYFSFSFLSVQLLHRELGQLCAHDCSSDAITRRQRFVVLLSILSFTVFLPAPL